MPQNYSQLADQIRAQAALKRAAEQQADEAQQKASNEKSGWPFGNGTAGKLFNPIINDFASIPEGVMGAAQTVLSPDFLSDLTGFATGRNLMQGSNGAVKNTIGAVAKGLWEPVQKGADALRNEDYAGAGGQVLRYADPMTILPKAVPALARGMEGLANTTISKGANFLVNASEATKNKYGRMPFGEVAVKYGVSNPEQARALGMGLEAKKNYIIDNTPGTVDPLDYISDIENKVTSNKKTNPENQGAYYIGDKNKLGDLMDSTFDSYADRGKMRLSMRDLENERAAMSARATWGRDAATGSLRQGGDMMDNAWQQGTANAAKDNMDFLANSAGFTKPSNVLGEHHQMIGLQDALSKGGYKSNWPLIMGISGIGGVGSYLHGGGDIWSMLGPMATAATAGAMFNPKVALKGAIMADRTAKAVLGGLKSPAAGVAGGLLGMMANSDQDYDITSVR